MKNKHRNRLKDTYYSGDLGEDAYEYSKDISAWCEVLMDACDVFKHSGEKYSIKEDVKFGIKMVNRAMYELKSIQNGLNNLPIDKVADED